MARKNNPNKLSAYHEGLLKIKTSGVGDLVELVKEKSKSSKEWSTYFSTLKCFSDPCSDNSYVLCVDCEVQFLERGSLRDIKSYLKDCLTLFEE